MKVNLLPISQYIQSACIDLKAASIAVGIAVSRHMDMPSASVDSINLHYVTNVEATANKIISDINEDIILDMNVCFSTTRAAYMQRYGAAYPNADGSAILPTSGSFFERLYGVGSYFDESTRAYMESNSDKIITLANRILVVLPVLMKD